MKKITLMTFTLILTIAAVASAADAGRFGVGFNLGAMNMEEKGFDSTVLPSLTVSYGADTDFSVELSVGGTMLKGKTVEKVLAVDEDGIAVEEETEFFPDLTVIPLQLTMQPRFHFGRFSPYVGVGISYYFVKADRSSDMKAFIREMRAVDPTFDIPVKATNAFGAHAGIGCDYFVTSDLAIGLDAKYISAWGFQEIKVTSMGETETAKDQLKLNSTVFGIGVKYLF